MYLEHFGLTDFPFIQSARKELFFSTDESLAHCADVHHWLDAGHGLLTIAGEKGVGRAALAHHALDTTPLPVLEKLVVSSLPLSPAELLQSIALQMGLSIDNPEPIQTRHEIRTHLRAQASLSRRVCIIVHDADKLDDQTHAFLEDLSKDHTLYLPLCHIILLVEKPFAARIAKQKRATGARHIHKIINIKALRLDQTCDYIEHRFSQVDAAKSPLLSQTVFSVSIIKTIFQQTAGKPHLINALCDASLVQAYLDGDTVMCQRHLQKAISDIGWDSKLKPASRGKSQSSQGNRAQRKAEHTVPVESTRGRLGALEQSVHELVSGVTTIGRAPDCTIRIEGEGISPYQALIVRTVEGMFIRNEATKLPLYLNGNRVESANLSAGDTLALASYRFSVDLDATGTLNLVLSVTEKSVAEKTT